MSATPPSIGSPGSSTRPYLIRALHDWCTDNGFTPYVAVFVDEHVRVPMEYVKNNEIVLNVGFEATTIIWNSRPVSAAPHATFLCRSTT
jgi:stringent starvation protein B